MITQLQLEDLRNEARRQGIQHKMNVFDIAADSIEVLQRRVGRFNQLLAQLEQMPDVGKSTPSGMLYLRDIIAEAQEK